MNILKNIVQSGILFSDEYLEKRSILLSNYISLLLSACLITIFIARNTIYANGTPILSPFFLAEGLAVLTMPLLLNRFGFTYLSRLVLCIGSMGFVWHIYIYYLSAMSVVETSFYDGLRIYLLALSPLPFLIFDKNLSYTLICISILSLLSLIFFEQILGLAGVNHAQRGIPGEDYPVMTLRAVMAYLILCGGYCIFHLIIFKNDIYNQKILAKLKAKTLYISKQNKKLKCHRKSLKDANSILNDLVEIKTKNINLQNERLTTYAHLNAHEVRGPLARLLGLLYLSKIDPEVDYHSLFKKIETEAKNIDLIIKDMSGTLYDAENFSNDDSTNFRKIK